jgi:hypothetical protein
MYADKYSCIWGFMQQIQDQNDVPSIMSDYIYHEGSDGTVNKGFRPGTGALPPMGYVISGTNTEGPIYTDAVTIESPGQSTLESRASSVTQNPSTALWWPFPGDADVIQPDINRLRHPGDAWNAKY